MPIFKLTVLAGDRDLTPPVAAEFEDWSQATDQATDVCQAILESGICGDDVNAARLVVEDTQSRKRVFNVASGMTSAEVRVNDQPGKPNLIRCLQ